MNSKSAHIERMPEAEYEIIDSGPSNGLQGIFSGGSLVYMLSWLGDKMTGNRRGRIATLAIKNAGLATDPDRLDQVYDNNHEAIDAYLNEIDMAKVSQMVGDEAENAIVGGTQSWIEQKLPMLMIGVVLGTAGLSIYNAKFKK